MRLLLSTTCLVLLSHTRLAHSQKIYIDQVPEYAQLPACAEVPLSTIVHNMEAGKCGDGGMETSFSCFCGTSSTAFNSIISEAVSSRCMPQLPEATASALAVFDSYCHLSAAMPTQGNSPQSNTAVPTLSTIDTPLIKTASSPQVLVVPTPTPTQSDMAPIPSSAGTSRAKQVGGGLSLASLTGLSCLALTFL